MKAKELLKDANVGDVILFEDKVIGLVIEDWGINKKLIINKKAILLTNFNNGDFYGDIADGYLDINAKIMSKVNCIKIK